MKEKEEFIYVIFEPMYASGVTLEDLEEGRFKYEDCIKIGYSGSLESRQFQYKSTTPRVDFYMTIEGGTEDDEKRLHKYFSKYQRTDLEGRREWFEWNKEIINFFKTHPTIESIREAIPDLRLSDKKRGNTYKNFITPITFPTLSIMIKNRIGLEGEEELEEEQFTLNLLRKYSDKKKRFANQGEFINFLRPSLKEEEIDLIVRELERRKEVEKELTKFDSLSKFTEKMEFLYNLQSILTKDNFSTLLDFLPPNIKHYVDLIGLTKMKALNFHESVIKKECDRVLDNGELVEALEEAIYSEFEVGKRYLRSNIKDSLDSIYRKIGYKAFPKSTDIKNYFNIKPCLITNPESGKRENGFELLSRK